jgi:hypothetical protein
MSGLLKLQSDAKFLDLKGKKLCNLEVNQIHMISLSNEGTKIRCLILNYLLGND